jgi:hypothetical protein
MIPTASKADGMIMIRFRVLSALGLLEPLVRLERRFLPAPR